MVGTPRCDTRVSVFRYDRSYLVLRGGFEAVDAEQDLVDAH